MKTRASALIAASTLAGSLCLLSANPALGAAFRVGWDPQYEATGVYANLGFKGSGDLTMDDGCISSTTTGEISVLPNTTCASAYFTTLTLDLYNDSDSNHTVLESLTYAPPDQDVAGIVTDVIMSQGNLAGIDTVFLGPVYASPLTAGPGNAPLPVPGGYIFMRFVSGYNAILTEAKPPNVILKICSDKAGTTCDSGSTGAALMSFTPEAIPEPGTAVLAMTALGALGWLRRRRKS